VRIRVQKRAGNTKVANNQNTAFAPKNRNKAPKEAHRIKGEVGGKRECIEINQQQCNITQLLRHMPSGNLPH
jgi:hypothetical protein